jgi:2-polyprenyl-6-methoxyphenol hydroxylase-like FAD-dependent oxidoreductase
MGGDDGVVIVGAGPTGLFLAGELALAGVPCLVLERRDAPRTDSRAICLHARSMETLDLRGQAAAFAKAGRAIPAFPLGPKGAVIRFGSLDSDFPYLLDIPQSQIEQLLAARALELGAEIRWSSRVTGIEQDDGGVHLVTADVAAVRAAYAVGCDGVRSFVRAATGVPFPGFANPGSVILADLHLDGLPMTSAYGDQSRDGMLLMFPFRNGSCRVVLYDYARADVPVAETVTIGEVRAGLQRITGQDLRPRDMYWSGRYRSESRQVPAYRRGRILLAGDAAHAHSPAGAQGLNTGLQDAMNLGWKLGAVLAGWAPERLLDSYHDERHPVGQAVLALTGRRFRLNTARTPSRRALRWGAHHLVVPLPPVQARLARDYSGVSISYPQADAAAHPMAGERMSRGVVSRSDGSAARLSEFFHDGRFVLFEPATAATARDVPGHVAAVSYARCRPPRLPAAMLVRPDGYVAWASDEPGQAARAAAISAAVAAWCAPGSAAQALEA